MYCCMVCNETNYSKPTPNNAVYIGLGFDQATYIKLIRLYWTAYCMS